MARVRCVVIATAALLAAAACGTGGSDESRGGDRPGRPLDQIHAGPSEHVPSALEDMTNPAFPDPLVDPDEIVPGGPPPDGIPSIDEPRFQRARNIGWLDDAGPVLTVTVKGQTRGYPVQILMWHPTAASTGTYSSSIPPACCTPATWSCTTDTRHREARGAGFGPSHRRTTGSTSRNRAQCRETRGSRTKYVTARRNRRRGEPSGRLPRMCYRQGRRSSASSP